MTQYRILEAYTLQLEELRKVSPANLLRFKEEAWSRF